ncbi:MAG TPA: pteridine reductase [Gammaproteobacteria bacterium]|nr:pteridine reductase [Gammaproteobacteria bacterium]
MDHLTGRVALVTGGAQRVGAGIVHELHARGMQIMVHYRSSGEAATRLVDELNARREDSAASVGADLADPQTPQRLVSLLTARFGGLDLLVNSASAFVHAALAALTVTQWQKLIAANLTAPLFLSRAFAPLLAEHEGTIVNITDAYAARLPAGYAAYAATKAALADLTRSLARELAPKIRVNAVAPGAILWPQPEPEEAAKQKVLASIPLARLGAPDDIARAVAFLAAEPYLTGVILPVDGGRSLF